MKSKHATLALAIAGATIAPVVSAAPVAGQTAPPGLDAYVERVMRTFEVPGVALAIVKDGRVVLTRGYGVRTLGEPEPVDEHTLFGIASNTKAVTATALGILVEEGKLEWDRPVIEYMPWFRMSDPYVTAELTVRDLLVHRSGLSLGAGDLMWWPASTFGREETVRRLKDVPLTTSFRSDYAYDNVLFIAAGQLVEEVSGQPWEEFVRERILEPAGMEESAVTAAVADGGGNIATPHARVDGTVQPVAPFTGTNSNPAAGIHSNAEDMAEWLLVQLDSGRVASSGERIFEPATATELWTLVTPMPIGAPSPGLAAQHPDFRGYALGFEVREYRGRKLVRHSGGFPGYVSRLAMIPEEDVGVVVLTNMESGAAFDAIAFRVLDHYLGASDTDWLAAYEKTTERGRARMAEAERRIVEARRTGTTPSLPIPAYAGTYRDPWYGDVVIEQANGGLSIDMTRTPWLKGTLEHWHDDTFLVRFPDEVRGDAFLTFHVDERSRITHAHMVPWSPAVDFSFDYQDLRLEPVSR